MLGEKYCRKSAVECSVKYLALSHVVHRAGALACIIEHGKPQTRLAHAGAMGDEFTNKGLIHSTKTACGRPLLDDKTLQAKLSLGR